MPKGLRYAWGIYIAALLVLAAIWHTGDDWRQYHLRELPLLVFAIGIVMIVVSAIVVTIDEQRSPPRD
jgi:hypothetical protein